MRQQRHDFYSARLFTYTQRGSKKSLTGSQGNTEQSYVFTIVPQPKDKTRTMIICGDCKQTVNVPMPQMEGLFTPLEGTKKFGKL